MVDPREQLVGAEGVLLQEMIGGGDLDGGSVLTAEEHGLLGAVAEVTELGALHRGEFGGSLGGNGLRQVRVAQIVQGTSDTVSGFDESAV